MGIVELILIGVGLSMDAFAVAICQGLSMTKLNWRCAGVIGLFFGGFQAIMPLLGWILGSGFARYVQPLDHWLAFVLLMYIGIGMIREALSPGEAEEKGDGWPGLGRLFMMALATSIDALVVGITFAFLEVPILQAVSMIGITTFCLSVVGVAVGNYFGTRYKCRAEITGGVILMLLGIKILLEHLGVL